MNIPRASPRDVREKRAEATRECREFRAAAASLSKRSGIGDPAGPESLAALETGSFARKVVKSHPINLLIGDYGR